MTPTPSRNPPTPRPAPPDRATRRTLGRATRRTAAAALLLLALPGSLAAAEPFYQARLEEGILAYVSGSFETAIRDLRLACFGLLEEPRPLAKGLTYLALAQAGAGDREAFSATFRRLLEVEQRFQGYSEAELAPAVRQAFEAQLERWESLEILRSVPAFAAVARRMLEARIVALPPAERRQELERRLAAEPQDAVWRLLMAELELTSGNFEAARAAAEPVAAREPEGSPRLPWALCIRGRASAAVGDCGSALRDLPACARAPLGVEVAEIQLQCYAQLGDWKRGMVLASELPPEQRQSPAIRRLTKLFERQRRQEIRSLRRAPKTAAGEAVGGAETAPAGTGTAGPDVQPEAMPADAETEIAAGPAAGAAEPAAAAPATASLERASLVAEARAALRSSGSREELTAFFERVRAEADRKAEDPELRHLAAELAYRLRRWNEVVTYFAGGGGDGPPRPDQQFYLAVARYEIGDRAAAARLLDLCLPHLEKTELVRGYAAKIRGER